MNAGARVLGVEDFGVRGAADAAGSAGCAGSANEKAVSTNSSLQRFTAGRVSFSARVILPGKHQSDRKRP